MKYINNCLTDSSLAFGLSREKMEGSWKNVADHVYSFLIRWQARSQNLAQCRTSFEFAAIDWMDTLTWWPPEFTIWNGTRKYQKPNKHNFVSNPYIILPTRRSTEHTKHSTTRLHWMFIMKDWPAAKNMQVQMVAEKWIKEEMTDKKKNVFWDYGMDGHDRRCYSVGSRTLFLWDLNQMHLVL